jgi:hypothetical protein
MWFGKRVSPNNEFALEKTRGGPVRHCAGACYDRVPNIAHDRSEHSARTTNGHMPQTVPDYHSLRPWCEGGGSFCGAMRLVGKLPRLDAAVDVAPLQLTAGIRGLPLKVLDVRHIERRGNTLPTDALALIDRFRTLASSLAGPEPNPRSLA